MTKLVVGWFEDGTVRRVVTELEGAGFDRNTIRVRTKNDGGRLDDLASLGIPRNEAKVYSEELAGQGALVTVDTAERDAPKAMQIMKRCGARDFGDRIGRLATTARAKVEAKTLREEEGERVIPVVQEEVVYGKREVETGGVRIHTRMVEEPVDQDVVLREEHVRVERRRVDRPIDVGDVARAVVTEDYEVVEHAERPVVGKRARVVEEIHISKTTEERTERMHDTVRHTEVDVEKYQPSEMRKLHRSHFDRIFGKSGLKWENVEPAYRYGDTLGADARMGSRDWSSIEAEARSRWEREHPGGGWERVKEAVRHAYDRARVKYTERHP